MEKDATRVLEPVPVPVSAPVTPDRGDCSFAVDRWAPIYGPTGLSFRPHREDPVVPHRARIKSHTCASRFWAPFVGRSVLALALVLVLSTST